MWMMIVNGASADGDLIEILRVAFLQADALIAAGVQVRSEWPFVS
jgi:hypothetical protein